MSDYALAYRTVLTVTYGDSGLVDAGAGLWYKEFTIPAVKMPSAQLTQQVAESRIRLVSDPTLTMEHRGAFVKLQSATKLRLYWRGELQTDGDAGAESISAYVEIFDVSTLGNDVKEILFRTAQIRGQLGANLMQDLPKYDGAGNPTSYRLRIFDTAANLAAATRNLTAASPLQPGEILRFNVTASYSFPKGDVSGRAFVLENQTTPTPGVS